MANVAIIGTGFIGRAWAISFARAGSSVKLWDADPAAPRAALDYIARILPDLERNGLLREITPDGLMGRLSPTRELAGALADADHVQENTPEDLPTKRRVFTDLDRLSPRSAILASSTSALLPSAFTEHLPGRERCIVVHPLNPPYLIPAAEVVPALWTTPTVVERTANFLRAAGHAPIVMKREIDGFLMNRLQGALLEEAFRLVADEYATSEDVDIGLREGLALRWSFMGPFETIDLNAPGGIDDYIDRYQQIYARLFPSMQRRVDWAGAVKEKVTAERRERVPAQALPERQAWRDRRLMALAAHKQRVATEDAERRSEKP